MGYDGHQRMRRNVALKKEEQAPARTAPREWEPFQSLRARPEHVSERAKERQRREMGTLGSGNHYLEVQTVAEVFDTVAAETFGLALDDVVVTIHCGSRGLGDQIGTEFLKEMVVTAKASGIELPDRELACAPIHSDVGQRYLGAMRAAINCALADEVVVRETHMSWVFLAGPRVYYLCDGDGLTGSGAVFGRIRNGHRRTEWRAPGRPRHGALHAAHGFSNL